MRWAPLEDDEVAGEDFNDKYNSDSGNRMPDSGNVRYFYLSSFINRSSRWATTYRT